MLSLTGMVITVVFKTFLIKGLNSVNHANRSRACRQEAVERGSWDRGSWDRGSWAVDRGSWHNAWLDRAATMDRSLSTEHGKVCRRVIGILNTVSSS